MTKSELKSCAFCLNEAEIVLGIEMARIICDTFGIPQKEEPKQECKQTRWPCGCVSCTCEDEVQCHGCGAKNCGLITCVRKSPSTSPSECEVEEFAKDILEFQKVEQNLGRSKYGAEKMAEWFIKKGYSKFRRNGK
jgi:hypothetical protein